MCFIDLGDWVNVDNHDGGRPEPPSTAPKPTPKPVAGKPRPKPKPKPTTTTAPKKIVDQSEAERLRARFSTKGWPGTILTSGLGDTSSLQVGGVTLGV